MREGSDIITRRADSLTEDHEALLAALIALRKKHGITQAVVAERMGVSQPTVAGLERYGANPTLSTIRRYALAVGARLHTAVIDDGAGAACPEPEGAGPSVSDHHDGSSRR